MKLTTGQSADSACPTCGKPLNFATDIDSDKTEGPVEITVKCATGHKFIKKVLIKDEPLLKRVWE